MYVRTSSKVFPNFDFSASEGDPKKPNLFSTIIGWGNLNYILVCHYVFEDFTPFLSLSFGVILSHPIVLEKELKETPPRGILEGSSSLFSPFLYFLYSKPKSKALMVQNTNSPFYPYSSADICSISWNLQNIYVARTFILNGKKGIP